MACEHAIESLPLPPQRNALRVETFTPGTRCILRPKTDQFGREINVVRYVMSGGCASGAADYCVGRESPKCPLSSGIKGSE